MSSDTDQQDTSQAQAGLLAPAAPTAAPQHQAPRFKRLASKPLKLAASAIHSVSHSRAPSPGPSQNNLSSSSSSTLDPQVKVAQAYDAATATGGKHASSSSGRRRRLPGRRRHQRLRSEQMDPSQIAGAARGPRKPLDGEEPAAWLRVRVVSASGLVAKDRGNTSDPFISLTVPPSHRHSTPVMKRTLEPVFPPGQSTFDFPLYLSLAAVIGGRGLEGVVWDKDLMRKEYMGEFVVPVHQWFDEGPARMWAEDLQPSTHRLLSTRRKHKVTGTVALQIGLFHPGGPDALRTVQGVYEAILHRSSASHDLGVLGVPAHEGIGTVKMRHRPGPVESTPLSGFQAMTASLVSPLLSSHKTVPAGGAPAAIDDEDEDSDELEDDGLTSSSDEDVMEDALTGDEDGMLHELQESPQPTATEFKLDRAADASVPAPAEDRPAANAPPATALLAPSTPVTRPAASRQSSLPGYFGRAKRRSTFDPTMTSGTDADLGTMTPSTSGLMTPGTSTPGPSTPGTGRRKPLFKRSRSRMHEKKSKSTKDFNLDRSDKDVLGIVVMEVKGATDLPRIKNALRVGWDMDPFVVVSFGKKVFRTRVIRHSLNPTWDEKLLFHVRRHESTFTIQMAVLDWDKISGNDMVGTCTLPIGELMADAPKPAENGLYAADEDGKHDSKEFTLPILTPKDQPWEARHQPKITIRAKYEPYDALRQRFWRQYIAQYDADDTNTMSYIELSSMLDSLGSTLTQRTIEGYFSSCGKSAECDELTMDEAILCLEREVNKRPSEKNKVTVEHTGAQSPAVAGAPLQDGLEPAGPQGNLAPAQKIDVDDLAERIRESKPRDLGDDGPGNQRNANEDVPALKIDGAASDATVSQVDLAEGPSGAGTPASNQSDADADDSQSSASHDRERVINIKTCPLCHRSRLGKRSEQDIVTHLAICASNDWSRVDRIVTGNYVTSSQAQRKFFTKILNHITIGAYSLGANSANILVQDRATGQLQEEKMAVYVRLGIRVLYKAARSQMEGGRARRLLKSLSVKQGLKYDSPSSAVDIAPFIAFHNLDVDEIRDPLDSFKTFNQFFYRKLKPGARPIEEPDNPARLVSAADCRMMAFESVQAATDIWIKGREFTIARLLGPNYRDVVDRYEGGALAIFRLAPQDYHRFHSPVRGTVGKMTLIDGEYYTVNPQAIRTALDVYGENVRKIVPIHSEEFGLVMTVWVGAMMVGSIGTSVDEGQLVDRGDELGWFAFGGSTIVCVFERNSLVWDDDLLNNGRASIETLVRMGSGIGRATGKAKSMTEKGTA